MTSALIELSIDQKLRDNAEAVCAEFGMDLETAVQIFLKELVLENGLPFRPKADPFFSPANLRHLQRLHDDVISVFRHPVNAYAFSVHLGNKSKFPF